MTKSLVRSGAVLLGVVAGVVAVPAWGQQQAPAFEVASVKRNGSWFSRGFSFGGGAGQFTATNVPLRELILAAYQVQPFQVEGGPAWINSDHFDIVAKLPGVPPPPRPGEPTFRQLALRRLLAERFKLVLRHQTKDFPVYALVTVRPDGKLGPRLHKSTTDCTTAANRSLCSIQGFQGGLQSRGLPIGYLAANLSPLLQRVVLDRTGLTGNYDFDLTWTPDQLLPGRGEPPPGAPRIDPNGPSLFTAMQEQLGLKLESTKGPVDVLVIDHVEKPASD
jgi:uncharacterized protein (TIGR03435 family)